MLKEFKLILILLLVVPLLASCAGTGTKEFSTIQKTAGDQSTSVFFVRETTFVAGGVGANIFIDGQQIGTLGNGEMLRYDLNSGEHTILTKGKGVGGILMMEHTYPFDIKKSENKYFEVEYKTKLLGYSGTFKVNLLGESRSRSGGKQGERKQ